MARKRKPGGGHHGADERWLLTYADMITLLMCLFMVLWSISSVNISKYQELQRSLQEAFTGKVLDGGQSVMDGEGARVQGVQTAQPSQPTIQDPTVIPNTISRPIDEATAAQARQAGERELEDMRRIQRQVEQYARRNGFSQNLRTTIDERGLVIRLLTDKVLFDSGAALVKAGALPLLDGVAGAIRRSGVTNPIRIEGHTDNVPIVGGVYPSNWELSVARSAAVLQRFLTDEIPAAQLSLAGYADQKPIAPNATDQGRAMNRRVEVVVTRKYSTASEATP